jgi:chromate transporter
LRLVELSKKKMREILTVFLRIGLLGFGGPVATIAMMEEELCRKRNWLNSTRFTEMYSLCKMLPGPVATQMAIYLGYERAGVAGGLVSGSVFILPAFLLVLILSYFYVQYGVPQNLSPLFLGMQIGALSVILVSLVQLSKPYRTKWGAWIIAGVSAMIVGFSPGWEPIVILFWGLSGGAFFTYRERMKNKLYSWAGLFLFLLLLFSSGVSMKVLGETLLLQIFWVCFKAGAFVFGTGLAVVPVLENDVVQKFHWLTHSEFMDGIAIGQITPGPYVITATFIGYKAAGWGGAIVSTLGIFLPAFFNILYIVPRIWKKVRGSQAVTGFSAWAIPSVIGGILGALFSLGKTTLHSPFSVLIFLFILSVGIKFKIPGWVLIPLAGLLGAIFSFY